MTQLQRKGVSVKGFGYLVKDYLGLVVHYSVLVRVFWWIFYFGEISLERDIVLVEESILKKFCWVFSPTRVSQDKSCVTMDVFLSIILMHAVIVLID